MNKIIFYVPGLGGEKSLERQRSIVENWNNTDTKAVFLESNWADKEELFGDKLKRLTDEVKSYDLSKYSKVTLLGASAGGTLGLNVFNELKDNPKVYFVAICGKITCSKNIGRSYSLPHPALIPSVAYSEKILKNDIKPKHRSRITSVIPLFDEVVHKKCMNIDGARILRQPTILHVPSIALGITLFRNRYIT